MSARQAVVLNRWVREIGLTLSVQAVAHALIARLDKQYACWPSIATIARDSKASKASVKRALSELERRGILLRERRTNIRGACVSTRYHWLIRCRVMSHPLAHGEPGVPKGTELSQRTARAQKRITKQEAPRAETPEQGNVAFYWRLRKLGKVDEARKFAESAGLKVPAVAPPVALRPEPSRAPRPDRRMRAAPFGAVSAALRQSAS